MVGEDLFSQPPTETLTRTLSSPLEGFVTRTCNHRSWLDTVETWLELGLGSVLGNWRLAGGNIIVASNEAAKLTLAFSIILEASSSHKSDSPYPPGLNGSKGAIPSVPGRYSR